MKLKTVKLQNFRSYRDEVVVCIDDLTALVGQNDAGKSTVLEALEIFFNNTLIKIESADAAQGGNAADVRISCLFEDLPEILTIDSRAETTLADEFLLNEDGYLEITKVYNCSLKTPTCTTSVRANYPTAANCADLHKLKNADLKLRLAALGIATDGIDQRSNVKIRQAIWANQADLALLPLAVSLDEEDGKKVWTKLKEELPLYALFQSDRASTDDDSEVQDPMKLAVQEALGTVQQQLDEIKDIVQRKVQEVAQRTLEKLREMSPELANELTPKFKSEPKWDGLFKLSLTDDQQIPINKRGSGTRRLILINFFRAEAERKQKEKNARGVIYAIEEPETSQHPSNQKLLIEALMALSDQPGCQVLLTTHTPNLAGLIPTQHLRYITKTADGKVVNNTCDDETLQEIALQLGVLPDKRIQVLFCVEGPTDVDFFLHISSVFHGHDSSLPNLLHDKRVAILPLGGSTLKQWAEKFYSQNLSLPEVHVYDRDIATPPTYQVAVDRVNARGNGSWAGLTNKREIENYLHHDALYEAFGVSCAFTGTCNVPERLSAEVNADGAAQTRFGMVNSGRAKKLLHERATRNMTLERVRAMDDENEIETWLRHIADRLN